MKSSADEYVKAGMIRFVTKKYSPHILHGSMLGYVLDGDVARAMKNVLSNIRANRESLRLATQDDWSESVARLGDPFAKETKHARIGDHKPFCLQHMFVSKK
jgi:hypothetical protein